MTMSEVSEEKSEVIQGYRDTINKKEDDLENKLAEIAEKGREEDYTDKQVARMFKNSVKGLVEELNELEDVKAGLAFTTIEKVEDQ